MSDIDFELELTKRDEINVSYILRLIAQMVDADEEKQVELKKMVSDTMANTVELRSRCELIVKFIDGALPSIGSASNVEGEWAEFVSEEQLKLSVSCAKKKGWTLRKHNPCLTTMPQLDEYRAIMI